MNVLLLTRNPGVPSTRYRVLRYVPYLEAAGAQVRVEAIPSGRRRRRLLRTAADFDSVLFQKRLLRPAQVRYLRRHARRLVFDFDDAILFRSPRKARPESWTRARRFRAVVGAADLVIAGNDYLRELAQPFARRVTVLPTVIAPEKYERAAAARREAEAITVGWIGGRSALRYVLGIGEALERIGSIHPDARLKIVCDAFPKFENIRVEEKPWREADEAEDVASFDIAIAPAEDDPWSRGKCGLKVLQYLAASRPVVCSPIGVQRDMVRDGASGFWARTTDEWVRALSRLIASASGREKMGAAGKKILEERYTIEHNAPKFIEAVTGRPVRYDKDT